MGVNPISFKISANNFQIETTPPHFREKKFGSI